MIAATPEPETPPEAVDFARLFAEAEIRRLLPARYRAGFPALQPLTPEHERLIERARAWADAWRPGARGLIFAGTVGCGKTAMACAIAARLIHRGIRVVRWNAADLLVEIKATWDTRGESESDLIDEILENQVIVLDDLGVEAPLPWVTERLYLLINRLGEENRTLIVTTNETAASLSKRYGKDSMGLRILSRVKGFCDTLGAWPDIDLRKQPRGQEAAS